MSRLALSRICHVPYRTVKHSWPFAGSRICPVPYRTIKHGWPHPAGHNIGRIMYMYTTPCVLQLCLKGTVALFVAPFYLGFQLFLLLVLPRGWLWVHQSRPWRVSEFVGRGFRDAVAKAVSFQSRPLSSSSLHSRWCS